MTLHPDHSFCILSGILASVVTGATVYMLTVGGYLRFDADVFWRGIFLGALIGIVITFTAYVIADILMDKTPELTILIHDVKPKQGEEK